MTYKISVIMSIFNESINELNDSIDSILSQSYRNFNFIIIDDNPNSTKLKNYLIQVSQNCNKILLLFNRTNLGAAMSRNRGIKHSRSKFIAIMDADDVAERNRLSSQIKFLIDNNLDFVFPNYRLISQNNNLLKNSVYSFPSIVNQDTIKYVFSYIGDISMNSGWLVKRDVFITLKGYRLVSSEDYDFVARAILYHYKLGYQSKILMSKRYRTDSVMRTNSLQIYLITKYIKHFLRKRSSPRIFTIKQFNRFIDINISRYRINRFNKFSKLGHKVKYNLNIINVIQLIYYMITTKFALSCMLDIFMNYFRKKKFISLKK